MKHQNDNKINLTAVLTKVSQQDREWLNGHKGAVIWLTGLPASGKSTLAVLLEETLHKRQVQSFALDGDNIRSGLSSDLDFTTEGRIENIRRVGELSKLFCEAGLIVITAFISPFRKKREFVRSLFPAGKFIEVFVDCPLAECERRDPKGHYQKAKCGEIPFFTGVSLPYESPTAPEIHLDTQKMGPELCVEIVLNYLIEKELIPSMSTVNRKNGLLEQNHLRQGEEASSA